MFALKTQKTTDILNTRCTNNPIKETSQILAQKFKQEYTPSTRTYKSSL